MDGTPLPGNSKVNLAPLTGGSTATFTTAFTPSTLPDGAFTITGGLLRRRQLRREPQFPVGPGLHDDTCCLTEQAELA